MSNSYSEKNAPAVNIEAIIGVILVLLVVLGAYKTHAFTGSTALSYNLQLAVEGANLSARNRGNTEGVDVGNSIEALLEHNPNVAGRSWRIERNSDGRPRFANILGSEIAIMPVSGGTDMDLVLSGMKNLSATLCLATLTQPIPVNDDLGTSPRLIGIGFGQSVGEARIRASSPFRAMLVDDAAKTCQATDALVIRYRIRGLASVG